MAEAEITHSSLRKTASSCGNRKCPSHQKAYRMTLRPSTSGLFTRTVPDFFKETRIRTCSSIKLIEGAPKAVSYSVASTRARSARKQHDELAKALSPVAHSVYQSDFINFQGSGAVHSDYFRKPLTKYDPNSVRSQMRDYTTMPNMKYLQSVRVGVGQ